MAHQAGAYPGFRSMKRLDWMLVHRRVTPSTHLYTWMKRGTVRVMCLSQEHNTMSPAWTARSGDERTTHEATAPPPYSPKNGCNLPVTSDEFAHNTSTSTILTCNILSRRSASNMEYAQYGNEFTNR